MKTGSLIFSFAVLLFIMFSGCYTMIQHPNVEKTDKNGYTISQKVFFYDDCNSCHNNKSNNDYVKKTDTNAEPAETYSQNDEDYNSEYNDPGNSGSGYYVSGYSAPYYGSTYYGSYGYFYNRPWWHNVAPPTVSVSNPGTGDKSAGQYDGRARTSDGSRSEATTRTTTTYFPPTSVSHSNSSGSSSGDTSKSNEAVKSNDKNSTKSREDNSKSSSGDSNARSNDGSRTTNSGRR
ncbi:MAG: hypothetical protein WCJ01_00555 [Ignavibacteria bacterium]